MPHLIGVKFQAKAAGLGMTFDGQLDLLPVLAFGRVRCDYERN
jgi:hypothetical protein